jgi:hypothetical protein
MAVKLSSGLLFPNSAPLLEEKGDVGSLALVSNGKHPFLLHRPGTRTALPADNDPVNSFQVHLAKIFQERLDR